ncbi:PleD family two-component system response regulator [Halioxenophilus sp. WMMB6]|uniref:response regulator n=1 Tax=Halioxenophilus sp. WMMB6 TaxID=3073815 RepID=UPI00295E33DD|nr:response regulator [Halioxenophilus sp. WMMB6]
MSKIESRVLAVDDSASDLQIIVENLKAHFSLSVAKSGIKALELAAAPNPPEVILLDVSMPGMDGYEACRKLKENPVTQEIDVIFISANDTTEEKLRGYEVGGSDYLIKPVQPEELLQKVRLTINNRQQRIAASEEKQSALNAAMTAIMEASEQSIIINFLRQSFSAVDALELAQLIIDTTASFGLSSIAQIRLADENINVSSAAGMSALERELLYRLKDSGRILQKGNRLILNFENITQIIKDLPIDDEERAGRLRDHLMLVLESANNQFRSLSLAADVRLLMQEFKSSMQSLTNQQKLQKLRSVEILDSMVENVNVEFLSCGLTEGQENSLLNIISQAVEAGLENFERGVAVDEQLAALAEQISEKLHQSIDVKEKIESVELF